MKELFLSVIPLTRNRLSDADVSVILSLSYELSETGAAGACIPVEMDGGQRMVAILDAENEDILLGFGCDLSGYYVFDFEGKPITEGCERIENVIPLLKQWPAPF